MKQLFIAVLLLVFFKVEIHPLHAQQIKNTGVMPDRVAVKSYQSWHVHDSLAYEYMCIDTAKLIYQYRQLKRINNNNTTPIKPPKGTEYYYLKSGCLFYTED